MQIKRKLTESIKKQIAGKQLYKCANKPEKSQKGLEDYKCILWQLYEGSFDECGYEIDHISEFSLHQDDDINNLQALCVSCHRVKTKRFMNKNNKINSVNNISVVNNNNFYNNNDNVENNKNNNDKNDKKDYKDDKNVSKNDDNNEYNDYNDNCDINEYEINDINANKSKNIIIESTKKNISNQESIKGLNNFIKFQCNCCKKTFSTKQQLNKHIINEVCINKKFSCEFCVSVFSSKKTMMRHMKFICKNIKKKEGENDQNNNKNNIKDKKDDECEDFDNKINYENNNINYEDDKNYKNIKQIFVLMETLHNSVNKIDTNIKNHNNIMYNISMANNNIINNVTNINIFPIGYGKEDIYKKD